ncbi:dihydrolipoyl dehydrogenase [Halodesulfovibrio sp.]|jgi:dihydrolipoamide dehydrogenase|uniref:dihydrolipoyl dehydrogenase n=1 Tax=Halodesulfovibrio sp. TaxID=1912772 RepID=UPI0025FD0EC3|nr:dihydrolipoyl dehydrogenase [Halodesulfovibrio sp.]MCT4535906.1 dihydrolipoyl dehydrogenase [Halodesulfovibrio sp.]MCT4626383.1 dihydrolipoyl dehydrogenase [Halodesulfovibrio sp.]
MPSITIIGSGPGGHIAAFEAARRGAEVTLVEKTDVGGTCLNTGCIPTKTLKSSAEALETAGKLAQFGIAAEAGTEKVSFKADMPAVIARKERVRKVLSGGLEKTCASLNIRLIRGAAELAGDTTVRVHTAEGTEEVKSDNIILATGSSTLDLPSLPVDHKHIINSDDALNLDHVPNRMVIVGGGVIGCELAFIYRAFGAQVTIVEGLDRLLPIPSVDEDMSRLLQREAKKHRIKVELAKTVKSATVVDGKVSCVLGPSPFVEGATGEDTTIEADVVLVAVGRTPNIEGLNLDAAGVEADNRGWIKADEGMRTSAKGIYAIGDALGPARIMLAHVASAEGLCAVANCFGEDKTLDYSVIPAGIFTSPEIGTVGLSETDAISKGFEVRSQVFQFRELGKAQAMGELPGMFKLICEKESGKILGVHIAGAHATDLIAEAALAIEKGLTAADLAHTIHAHPTLAEGLYEVAEGWLRGC